MGKPTELTDLEVDRVDAVDRPATRRKFLIVKAEGDAEGKPAGDPVAEAKRLIAAAAAAVGKIHKSAATHTDQGLVDALNELAIASGASERFTKAEAAPAAADATPAPAAAVAPAAPAPAAPADPPTAAAAPAAPAAPAPAEVAKADGPIDIAALAAAVGTAVVKALKEDIDKAEDKPGEADPPGSFFAPGTFAVEPPASAQPVETVPVAKRGPAKVGDGVFTDVFFGRRN